MSQKTRLLIAVAIILVIAGSLLGVEAFLRQKQTIEDAEGELTLSPGSIPIYVNGKLAYGFNPEDLADLGKISFVDAEEGKTQEGWALRDILRLYIAPENLEAETRITVSSSSRDRSVQLTWAEVDDPENWVLFDLSGRGTLKLVSTLEGFDTRDDWVQDTDKIEITTP